jgi:hypothetical protein
MVAVVEEMLFFEPVNGGGGGGGRDMRSRVLWWSVFWKAAASDHRLPTLTDWIPPEKQEMIVQRDVKTAPQ